MSVYVITQTRDDGLRMVLCERASPRRAELWMPWPSVPRRPPLSALIFATKGTATRAARRSSESNVVVEVEGW